MATVGDSASSSGAIPLSGTYDPRTKTLTLGQERQVTITKVAQDSFLQRILHFVGYSRKITVKSDGKQRTFYVSRFAAQQGVEFERGRDKKEIMRVFAKATDQARPVQQQASSTSPIEGPAIQPIAPNFTQITEIAVQRQRHGEAKTYLQGSLNNIGAQVSFISPPKSSCPSLEQVTINPQNLSADVFSYEFTNGVQGDIQRDGNRLGDEVVVYSAASQYNGAEAIQRETIKPGEACKAYRGDNTQGPQAQLAYPPEQVECINDGANIGFNGLCTVLDDTCKGAVAHGYLTPRSRGDANQVVKQLREQGHQVEYLCVANKPRGGFKPVHLILAAAPAFGGYVHQNAAVSPETQHEIQFLCALHAYRAQFAQCVALAKEQGKPVIFKASAAGLGVFGNDPKVVAAAFYQAATEYQDELKANNVQVRFQIFRKDEKADDRATAFANALGLKQLDRDRVSL